MKSDQSCRGHDVPTYASRSIGLMQCAMLAMICFAVVGAAQAAQKPAAAKASTAAAATGPEAKLPNDDVAMGIIARTKPSQKDNTAALMPLEGTWDYTGTLWTDPKAEPEHTMGTVTNGMVMDNHYLSSKAVGTVNIGRETIPVEGQEFIGFDTAKKSLTFVAIDTLTTGVTTGKGALDEKAKVIKETGLFTNPLTGAEQDFRAEIAFVDATHYKRTVYTVHKSGRDTKLMENDYTKRN